MWLAACFWMTNGRPPAVFARVGEVRAAGFCVAVLPSPLGSAVMWKSRMLRYFANCESTRSAAESCGGATGLPAAGFADRVRVRVLGAAVRTGSFAGPAARDGDISRLY